MTITFKTLIPAGKPKPRTEIVRNFTPNWFTVTMGTGVLALALNQLPFAGSWLHWLAEDLWLMDIVLFGLFSALYTTRWLLFFDEARRDFRHPVMSMSFGAVPMGLATIINGFLVFGYGLLGDMALAIAHSLWWIDVAMSLACGLAIPYFMFTRQEHSVEKLTAVWLLPIVAAEVSAVSGAMLIPHLPPAEALLTLLLSYVLWAYSVPLAMSVLVLLVLRLALHKLPERDMGPSAWLALGPIGTGSLGLVLLGGDAQKTFDAIGVHSVGEVAAGLGVIGGVVMWGYGAWWLALAALKTIHYLRRGLPFNLGWWGFTFPLGVYSLATFALARVAHFGLFTEIGEMLVVCLAAFWAIVASRTVYSAWHGDFFAAPCLGDSRFIARFEADAVRVRTDRR